MKHVFRKLCLVGALAAVSVAGVAQASVVIEATRVIFPAQEREVTIKLTNDGKTPALVQTWLDKGEANASPDSSLFYVADDRFRLSERVKRLMKRTAHAEFPHSRTRHVVSNVRIRSRAEAELEVSSAFITFRTKDGVTDTYFGSNRYKLVQVEGQLRIRDKRCLLDSEGLRMQGRVSIIL